MRYFLTNLYHNKQGFTLVEIIVALAISVLIVTGLSSTTMQLINNSQSNNNRMTAIRNLDTAGLWFVRDFEAVSAYPGSITLLPNTGNITIGQSILTEDDTTVIYSIDANGNLIRHTTTTNSIIGTNIKSIQYTSGTNDSPIKLTLTSKVGTNEVSRTVQVKTRIVNLGLFMVTTHLPSAAVNIDYIQQLIATGGTAPLTWSISGGFLPFGLSLNSSSGIISGRPTAEGSYTFTVQVADSASSPASVSRTFVLPVGTSAALAITTNSPLPVGHVGIAYSQTLAATGGTEPYTWSVVSGLPPGLNLGPIDGILAGVPTQAQEYLMNVRVTDNAGATVTKDLTVFINPLIPPTVMTSEATAIGRRSATLNGSLTSMGSETTITLYFQWGTDQNYSGDPVLATNPSQTMDGIGNFSGITGNIFTRGTTYHYRAVGVGNHGIIAYGNDQVFTTIN